MIKPPLYWYNVPVYTSVCLSVYADAEDRPTEGAGEVRGGNPGTGGETEHRASGDRWAEWTT